MVTEDVLRATARLSVDADFQVFMDEVARRRQAARDELEQSTDPWLAGRSQGASMLAGELIELVQSARAALARRQA